MAKRLTKTETLRLYSAITSKTKKLWSHEPPGRVHTDLMSTKDMITITNIISKYRKKLSV